MSSEQSWTIVATGTFRTPDDTPVHFEILHVEWLDPYVSSLMQPYHCGYVIFPPGSIYPQPPSQGFSFHRDYWEWSTVHGGITFHETLEDGSEKYGFDCAHAFDEDNPLTHDLDWLTEQCRIMMHDIWQERKVKEGKNEENP